jgi:alcohol dehydrogenase
MGAASNSNYAKVSQIVYTSIKLIVNNLPAAVNDGDNLDARYALGLGTDLGGYAIMIGGTNGGHLGSFSLVNLLSHGRACAILNPYYTMLFAPAIQDQLRQVAPIFKEAGYISQDVEQLKGFTLAESVTEGMLAFLRHLNFPTTLKEVGATEANIDKMIKAAKDPALKMKLQSMPVTMDVEVGDVDRLMKPTLKAAYSGDLSLIPRL